MKKLLSLTLAICLTSSSFALEWQMVGARQMGMGGAGVAIAQGTDAQYYNPALLASNSEDDEVEVGFNVGAKAEISPVLDVTRQLMRMSNEYKKLVSNIKDNSGDNVYPSEMNTIVDGFVNINDMLKDNKATIMNSDLGVGFKKGSFAVSIRSLNALSAIPVADNKNILLGAYGSYDGLSVSTDTTIPSMWAQDVDRMADAIDAAGARKDLIKLFGLTTTPSSLQLAAMLVNSLDEAVSTQEETSRAIDKLIDNMPQIAEFIKGTFSDTSKGSYVDNTTHVKMDLGSFNEASLGYGFNIGRGISLGANVKVIEGLIGESGIMILTDNLGVGSMMHETWNHKKLSTNVGIDVGAAVNFSELFQGNFIFNPTLAITAKNLNSPKFKRPEKPTDYNLGDWNDSDFKLNSQFRAGAAIHPFTDRLTIAADIDLNENDTFLEGKKSRQLASGVEYMIINRHTFKLPVRVGINKNLADSDAPTYFTAGFSSINNDFIFEMAATVGDSTEKLNGNNFPNVMGLTMSFAWAF